MTFGNRSGAKPSPAGEVMSLCSPVRMGSSIALI